MNIDILMLGAAPFPAARDAVRADQGEALRQHAGRGVEIAEPLDAAGGEAGFLLELLDCGAFDRRLRVLVADQPGGKLEAAPADRQPLLVDQDHLSLVLGDDDNRADVADAARIFPLALLDRADVFAFPHDGRRRRVLTHSSISLSGISLVSADERGKCSLSTAPT